MCAGGFFARDMAVLQAAAGVLLDPSTRRPTQFRRLLVASDAFTLADFASAQALYQARARDATTGKEFELHKHKMPHFNLHSFHFTFMLA